MAGNRGGSKGLHIVRSHTGRITPKESRFCGQVNYHAKPLIGREESIRKKAGEREKEDEKGNPLEKKHDPKRTPKARLVKKKKSGKSSGTPERKQKKAEAGQLHPLRPNPSAQRKRKTTNSPQTKEKEKKEDEATSTANVPREGNTETENFEGRR